MRQREKRGGGNWEGGRVKESTKSKVMERKKNISGETKWRGGARGAL